MACTRGTVLDLFCGAGGAAAGWARAGYEVIGVDIRPQPRYPFRFVQGDWEEMLGLLAWRCVLVHASPPCQAYSQLNRQHRRPHPDLVGPVRSRLVDTGLPYVIENVPGAPMRRDVVLCGSMFGLAVRRHRVFEASWPMPPPPPCRHLPAGQTVGVYGHSGGRENRPGALPRHNAAAWAQAMGIDWMTQDGLAQAIPPAYTEWVAGTVPKNI